LAGFFISGGKIIMMNYEIFKEVVAEKFMDYMFGQYKDMKDSICMEKALL